MAKITMTLAMSLDGFIADENGAYDWIKGDGSHSLDMTMGNDPHNYELFLGAIDVVIMGKKCYEQGEHAQFEDKTVYVITHEKAALRGVHFVDPLEAAAAALKSLERGKNVYLYGGGIALAPFIEDDLVDVYEIGIVPILLGRGRRLFYERQGRIPLKLTAVDLAEGVAVLKYERRRQP